MAAPGILIILLANAAMRLRAENYMMVPSSRSAAKAC